MERVLNTVDGEEKIDLNTYATSNVASVFPVVNASDAMIGAHICPGDLLTVDRDADRGEGSIVLAYDESGNWMVRRIQGDYLVAENSAYKPVLIEGDMIWGVVVGVNRRL